MRPRRCDGFTLLEILVTLSLLAAVIATLAGGLRLGTRAWESARVGASLDEANLIVRALAGQLARAFPAKLPRADGSSIVAFDGGPEWCRFVALSDGMANWGGLVTTEIGRDDMRALDAWTQVFRESDFGVTRQGMRSIRLSDALLDLRFSYFGSPALGERPRWRDDWHAAPAPPRLVRLIVRLRGTSGPVESAVTVALPLR
ncbi:type II secretion system protein J (GspJ) [Rhodoblastus acidophilus]|uniref:Type II secretion system protein J (GspJ) n=1 Tax=Rhodoblastus acidophilus TaxID=1074 RepID=A0A212SAJ2_RHOAC|nr:general secretion pathway protein J [Rhodoblastus acidophilus]PPQ35757.1 hypothetical protein CKO16_19720 [Rhodoblastus acidophilus]RAI20003.1 hypothetical protein CH337_10890 [Rhodoblastus acidophilus]SNB82543.1 type II secretion system protein J (GspJ) [Rhodoblastus acidophilus]